MDDDVAAGATVHAGSKDPAYVRMTTCGRRPGLRMDRAHVSYV